MAKAVSLQILAKAGFCQSNQFTNKLAHQRKQQHQYCSTMQISALASFSQVRFRAFQPYLFCDCQLHYIISQKAAFVRQNKSTNEHIFSPNILIQQLFLSSWSSTSITWCCKRLWERMVRASKTAVGTKPSFDSSYINLARQRIPISCYPSYNGI